MKPMVIPPEGEGDRVGVMLKPDPYTVSSTGLESPGAERVVRATRELFDGVASGRVNAMAALLRGALVAEGDPNLLVRLQRLFPSPPAGQ